MARNPYRRYEVTEYQKEALKFLQPPEDITVSEWADKYRVLDAKTSAMPGPWRTEHTPYLKGIMDEFNNYETEENGAMAGMTQEQKNSYMSAIAGTNYYSQFGYFWY